MIRYGAQTPPCPDCQRPMTVITGRTKDTGELKRTGLCVWCEPGLYPLPLEEEEREVIEGVVSKHPFE